MSPRPAGARDTGFLDRQVQLNGNLYRYQVYVPRDYDAARAWPVLLFLHGAGERGRDGLRQTAVGLCTSIRYDSNRFPMLVVFPQCPPDSAWLGEPADAAMEALDAVVEEFHGDIERTYLTGLSIGGYGVWRLAASHPRRFAALVPVCGGVVTPATSQNARQSPLTAGAADPYAKMAELVRGTPAWIFHGTDDPIIPVTESRRMAGELKKLGSPVTLTEYEQTGHASWDRAYGEEKLWTWLLGMHR